MTDIISSINIDLTFWITLCMSIYRLGTVLEYLIFNYTKEGVWGLGYGGLG